MHIILIIGYRTNYIVVCVSRPRRIFTYWTFLGGLGDGMDFTTLVPVALESEQNVKKVKVVWILKKIFVNLDNPDSGKKQGKFGKVLNKWPYICENWNLRTDFDWTSFVKSEIFNIVL